MQRRKRLAAAGTQGGGYPQQQQMYPQQYPPPGGYQAGGYAPQYPPAPPYNYPYPAGEWGVCLLGQLWCAVLKVTPHHLTSSDSCFSPLHSTPLCSPPLPLAPFVRLRPSPPIQTRSQLPPLHCTVRDWASPPCTGLLPRLLPAPPLPPPYSPLPLSVTRHSPLLLLSPPSPLPLQAPLPRMAPPPPTTLLLGARYRPLPATRPRQATQQLATRCNSEAQAGSREKERPLATQQ